MVSNHALQFPNTRAKNTMKSKLFKQHQKEQAGEIGQDAAQDEDGHDLEVEAGDPSVSSGKSSKMLVIAASAILITIVIYFLFFKGESADSINSDIGEEITNLVITNSTTDPAKAEEINDIVLDNIPESDILKNPTLPEIPELPELPKGISFTENVLPNFFPAGQENQGNQTGQNNPDTSQNLEPAAPPPEIPKDPRRSPIVVVSSGSAGSNSIDRDLFSGGIIPLNQNAIDNLESSSETQRTITPTLIKDRSTSIIQGKMMTAILETAINTEIPGSVRGIISRDVYAEAGNNVLIPKGSRLYGSYSTAIIRGQGRVEINWSRLIRPDGVDLAVGFVAADQFGRSGIEGTIDNKYGVSLANSLLTSVLAISGAIAAEKISGTGSNTTTNNPSTGTTTLTSSPSAAVITDVSTNLVNVAGQVISNSINTTPVIRVPQGTRITIIVNADMSIPKLKN